MQSRVARLDRFLRKHTGHHPDEIRRLVAAGQVRVDGAVVRHAGHRISQFSQVELAGEMLTALEPVYLMLNKPRGVVSATRDDLHPTVMSLLPEVLREGLHIAGRLDATSTGLLLLTNDGAWSRRLSDPENGISKRYRVTLQSPVSEQEVRAFATGIEFPTEGIRTRPAQLRAIDEHSAEVSLHEGRYHQIRRMFARCGNRATAIHRFAIGELVLPEDLAPGQYRHMDPAQARALLADAESVTR